MPTGKQIKAARMLLDWTAEDLAEHTNLTSETIFRIERATTNPKPETMAKVIQAFDEAGVEFIGDRGTAVRDDNLRVIDGKECYIEFLEFVYFVMRGSNEEVCFYSIDDRLSTARVTELCEMMHHDGLKTRFICEEGNDFTLFPKDQYRWIPKEFFNNDVQVVFGDYVGTLINKGEAVYVVHNKSYAQTQRKIFDFLWHHCLDLKDKNAQ